MYPHEIFMGMGLYEICILVGIIGCFATLRILGDKRKFSAKLQNTVLFCAFAAIVLGYLFAVLAQAVYNSLKTGVFVVDSHTGATFLGGLIGGAAVFIIAYFLAGHFIFKNTRENVKRFRELTSIAGACIAIAHAVGRVGCFFAGCCYGVETTSFLGVVFYGETVKRLPVQLFECAFLLLLYACLMLLHIKNEKFDLGLPVYMISYGIWRFLAEFMRGDDRGEFFIKALTPSQGTSILLILGGIALAIILRVVKVKNEEIEA